MESLEENIFFANSKKVSADSEVIWKGIILM